MAEKVAVIRGDGVGPELIDSALKVLGAAQTEVEMLVCEAGHDWWLTNGGDSLIPKESWSLLEKSKACLKAPTTTPSEAGSPRSVAVSIRHRFNLYANIRPIKTLGGRGGPLGIVDFVCVREATEGLYSGLEQRISENVAVATRRITRESSVKVARKAFGIARSKGWRKVIVVTKRNILKETDGLFLDSVMSVKKDFPEVAIEEYYIDNMAQQLVKNPSRFNQCVILSTNLFMDIISEEASGLVGSIGMVYSANLGDNFGMFEPAHGSAPKYRGLDKVNPTAMILSGAMMLEYLGKSAASKAIFESVDEVIAEGRKVTYDLGGSAKCSEMANAVAQRVANKLRR